MLSLTPEHLMRRRERPQNNFPPQAFIAGADGKYIESITPQPEEEFLRYEASELAIVSGDSQQNATGNRVPTQVIYDETAVSTAVRIRLANLRRRRQMLRSQYMQGLRVLFREALRAGRRHKKVWVVTQRLTVPVAVYRKTRHLATRRVRVELPPVKRPRTFYVRDERGVPRPRTVLVWVKRAKFVERAKIRTTRTKVGVKLVRRTIRQRKLVEYIDWAVVRSVYGEAKEQRQLAFARELADVREQIRIAEQDLKTAVSSAHTLITYTTGGYITAEMPDTSDPAYEPYVAAGWSLIPDNILRSVSITEEDIIGHWIGNSRSRPWYFMTEILCPQPFAIGKSLIYTAESEIDANDCLAKLRMGYGPLLYPQSCKSYWRSGEGRVPERLLIPKVRGFREYQPQANSHTSEVMLQAAGSVASLLKREDTSFRLIRSLLELKDTRETARPISDFVTFLSDVYEGSVKLPKSMRLRGGLRAGWSGLRLLASVYLTAKMAIQPTIADADVLINNTLRWAVDARRSLASILDELEKSKTNILHYRVKRTVGAPSSELVVTLTEGDSGSGVKTGTMSLQQFITMEGRALAGAVYMDASSGDVPTIESLPDLEEEAVPLADNELHLPIIYEKGEKSSLLESYADGWSWQYRVKPESGLYPHAVKYSTENIAEPEVVRFWWSRPQGDQSEPWTKPTATLSDQQRRVLTALPLQADWNSQPGVEAVVFNHVTVTAFARYSVDVVREYRDALQSGSLTNRLFELLTHFESLDAATTGIASCFAGSHKDEIRIIWDLTPLSFVFEWFSTVGDVIDRLNTFAEERVAPLPTSLDGTWGTERCELLAKMPALEPLSFTADAQVTRWHVGVSRLTHIIGAGADGAPLRKSKWIGYATAGAATITYHLNYQEGAVKRLTRTGLYRTIRGMVTPTFGDIVTPQVHVRLNSGKISSLVALLVSFLGGRRKGR